MLIDNAVRTRAERLAAMKASSHDVDLLLSDMRFLKGVHKLIKEIGHFAAHRLERDIGVAKEASDAYDRDVHDHLALGTTLVVGPRFTDVELARAMIQSLKSTSVLPKHRLIKLQNITEPLALSAICSMHGAPIKLATGERARLGLTLNEHNTLQIATNMPYSELKGVFFNLPLFSTSLTLLHPEGELVNGLADPQKCTEMDLTIERRPDGLLTNLR